MWWLIKASGYTSGDDALDDRESEEEMMKERKHDTAQVGWLKEVPEENLSKVLAGGVRFHLAALLYHSVIFSLKIFITFRTCQIHVSASPFVLSRPSKSIACTHVWVCCFSVPVPCLAPPQPGSQSDPKYPMNNIYFKRVRGNCPLKTN